MNKIFVKIAFVSAMALSCTAANAAIDGAVIPAGNETVESTDTVKKQLPAGLSQQQYDAISKQLPPGVTIEMIMARLPKGMTLQQALQMMAAQQKAKAEEAKAKEEAKQPQGKGGWQILPYFALNLGMTSSLGCPVETRSVESAPYNFNFAIGAYVSKRFSNKWGVLTGLSIERKGSNSNVIMKDYFTRVHIYESQPEGTQGYFSGRSQGWHDCYYVTMPLNAMYQPNKKWEVHFGPYFGWTISRDRHGLTSEGTIRQTPLSPEIQVDHSEAVNTNKVYKFDCGVMAGVTYKMWKQLYCLFDFSWGLTNVWDGSDYGMKKNIYNIYAKLGFGWKFEVGKKKDKNKNK